MIMLFLLIHNHQYLILIHQICLVVVGGSLDHLLSLLMGESSLTILKSHEDDPIGYYKAINDKNFSFWKEPMKSELESMYSNNAWTLVDLPQGVKPIGCKWVYKRKRGVDGKVQTYNVAP